MAKAVIAGHEMYYELHGNGEPVLLISGKGSTHDEWNWQIQDFSKNYLCITYDKRGSGESSLGRIDQEDYTIELLAADAIALLDQLNIKEAHIVGGSMGGTIAQTIAVNFPDRVLSLSLVVTWPRTDALLKTIFSVNLALNERLTAEEFSLSLAPWVWSAETLEQRAEVIRNFRKFMSDKEPVSQAVFRLQTMACLEFDVLSSLNRIKAPTMIIAGNDDILIPPRNAEMINHEILNSELKIFEGCGHALIYEKTEQFNKVTLEFLHCNSANSAKAARK
jgi:pimeloyl-ACP methyl ester carboxylesterase